MKEYRRRKKEELAEYDAKRYAEKAREKREKQQKIYKLDPSVKIEKSRSYRQKLSQSHPLADFESNIAVARELLAEMSGFDHWRLGEDVGEEEVAKQVSERVVTEDVSNRCIAEDARKCLYTTVHVVVGRCREH